MIKTSRVYQDRRFELVIIEDMILLKYLNQDIPNAHVPMNTF